MTRLMSPEGKDFKGPKKVVRMGPSTEELLGEDDPSVLEGPIKTAASYGARVKARQAKMAELKKNKVPVGTIPEVESEKMKQLASALAKPDFGEPPEVERAPVEPPSGADQMSGVGSGYEVNRAMAEGRVAKPVTMREARKMEAEAPERGKKELSPETKELLAKVKEESERGVSEDSKPMLDDDGSVSTDTSDEEAVSQALQPPMDFLGIEEQKSLLVNKERRDRIESRLEKLSIADMVMKRELTQDIPVIVGKNDTPELVYTLRTYRQHEYLYCLKYVYEHPGSAMYVEEMLNTCKMACSLLAINGANLIEHRTHVGQASESVDEELFERKVSQVASFPVHMIADISVQWAWFNDRINKLFTVSNLKNG